jgi:hypothetical protein
MRVAPRSLFICISILGLGLVPGAATATECDDIYPGARIGPPPEWTFWGDGSACFVRWEPQNPDHEERLLAQCRDTQGARFVHFEPDKGAGHSICIFKVPSITQAFVSKSRDELVSDRRETENALVDPVETPAVMTPHAIAIEPVAAKVDGPDPNRVAATAVCSSTSVGDYKYCLAPAQFIGANQFAFNLKSGCTTGSIAAVSTLDERGRCVRRVILLKGKTPAMVQSNGGSRVIDAIAFQDGLYDCYARRHENISCNGRIDYSDYSRLGTQSAVVKKLPRSNKNR